MAFRKIKGSYKNADITTHVIEATYLAHDTETGALRIGDGVTPGGTVVTTGSGGGGTTLFVGDDSATVEIASGGSLYIRGGTGITTSTDSDGTLTIDGSSQAEGISFGDTTSSTISIADGSTLNLVGTGCITATVSGDTLTIDGSSVSGSSDLGDLQIAGSKLSVQDSSTVGVGIENIRISNSTFTIDDSTDTGFEFTGHLVPSSDGIFDLGKAGKRWKTAYLAAETVDIGGGKIKIDSDGAFNFNAVDGSEMKISTSGAELPENSTVGGNKVQQLGATSGTGKRPIEKVKIFVSDGSTSFTDTQLLTGGSEVLTLEFNATVDTEPVFTQANQSFLLANGTEKQAIDSVTLFQF